MAKLSDKGVAGRGVKQAVRPPAFRIEAVHRRERYLKALIYGNYGVGKTTLSASATEVPAMNDVIMISAESGDLAVDHIKNLDAINVKDFSGLSQIHEFLKQHCTARDEGDTERLIAMEELLRGEKVKKPKQYRTVIMDSLTEIEAYCFNQLLGITDSTRLDEEVQSAEWAEYKKNNTMMLRVVRAFRDLPMNVIFIAGEKYNQDETKKYKFTPDMTGQLAKKIQGFMDMVGYYAMGKSGEERIRRLYVMPSGTGKYDAKHRYQAFKDEYFEDPTMMSILTETGLLNEEGTILK